MIVPKLFMSSFLDASESLRADCGSDHNPVVVKFIMRLKLPKERTNSTIPTWENISQVVIVKVHDTMNGKLQNKEHKSRG